MKRVTIIVLIVLVVVTLGVIIFAEFRTDEIRYVCDYKTATSTILVEKRLYSSGIDEEKVNELSQTLLTTSFTEDELLEAALRAGTPEFYPWFSFQVSGGDDNKMILTGNMGQDLFEGQSGSDFEIKNVTMEVTTDYAAINYDNTSIYKAGNDSDGSAEKADVIFYADDGSSLAVKLDRSGAYNIAFDGIGGSIMVQYTYDICVRGLLWDNIVLKDQILQLYITPSIGADGELTAAYEVIDASEVSDLY